MREESGQHEDRRQRSRRAMIGGCLALATVLVLPFAGAVQPPTPDAEADRRCLQCHGREHIASLNAAERLSMVGTRLDTGTPGTTVSAGTPLPRADAPAARPGLYVVPDVLARGPHGTLKCVDCHEDAAKLPHEAVLQKATCAAACHGDAAKAYEASAHRAALLRKDPLAPTCASCHGGHDLLRIAERSSPQHKLNSLFLCGDCHKQHSASKSEANPAGHVDDYLDSAHARAVTRSGLPMAATCADCHSAHGVRPSDDPESSTYRSNIPGTCGKCHVGVAEIYATSVHGAKHTESNGRTAVCTDCHPAHRITLASSANFVLDVIKECGQCHDSPDANGDRVGTYYETYHRSYHGQVTQLGGKRAARCSDCHGSHDIRPLDDPMSRVSAQNLVGTCAQCHPAANESFVKFDPHANHRDAKNFPVLHGVWLYFMIVMSAVFTFFGLHTLMWFARSTVDRARCGPPHRHARSSTAIRRFGPLDRINHAFVALTFFGLTATGIPLVFAEQGWAKSLAGLLGGVEAAGMWHRMFAVMLIANFTLHFIGLAHAFWTRTCSWKEWLFGPGSLVPRWKDVKDCLGMLRWFVGLGPRPKFDRWTYWEKFDYWAEVGGSVIIGGSGLLLWFPELASRVLPGWAFNVAMIVHGYEALLAIGFIFTIHFFNAHLRPGTFPVDEVIFTGSLPEHELQEQRPEEYRRLTETGKLEALRVPAPDDSKKPVRIAVAVVSVAIGVTLLVFIIIGGLS